MRLQSERFATGKGAFAYLPYAELLRVVRHTENGKIPRVVLDEHEELPSLVLVSSEVEIVQLPTPENQHTAIVKARLTFENGEGKQFVFEDYGECCGEILARKISAEAAEPRTIRTAVTRAKNRALRDALGVEDEEFLDASAAPPVPQHSSANAAGSANRELLQQVQNEFVKRCRAIGYKQSPGMALKALLQVLDQKEEVVVNFNQLSDLQRCLQLPQKEWERILASQLTTTSAAGGGG